MYSTIKIQQTKDKGRTLYNIENTRTENTDRKKPKTTHGGQATNKEKY